jgi:L-rhamnose mutarotase
MQRHANVIKVRPEKLSEYKELHAHCWKDVLKIMTECNITNYSIYFGGEYLFCYFEYVGLDYEADRLKMASNEITKKWWELTAPCQEKVSWSKNDEWWSALQEVFHKD